jgi:signal transduction histidine kinase
MQRKPPSAEGSHRSSTDDSLRKERAKSDDEVDRRIDRAAVIADAVVERARQEADEVLRLARDLEHRSLDPAQAQARGVEDATIREARVDADEKVADERRERTRALAALFALERELTDRHLQAERTRADVALKNRDDFLGIVAHDLRGFMGAIALRAALIVRESGDDEEGRRMRAFGERIQRSTAGMKRLVGDLLDVAAIEAGRLHVQATADDLSRVLHDAAESFRVAAGTKDIALEVDEAPRPVMAMFDHDRVIQVLGNLVGNAIKFTPAGGRITVALREAGDEVQITVADTGVGIAADKLERVFERYTQLTPSDRRGLGLGLYIARCLVEAQGGRIWAVSAAGVGSELTFTLPRA